MPADEPEQSFFETDEPELRAFGRKQTARKVFGMAATLVAIVACGVAVGWAMVHGMH